MIINECNDYDSQYTLIEAEHAEKCSREGINPYIEPSETVVLKVGLLIKKMREEKQC